MIEAARRLSTTDEADNDADEYERQILITIRIGLSLTLLASLLAAVRSWNLDEPWGALAPILPIQIVVIARLAYVSWESARFWLNAWGVRALRFALKFVFWSFIHPGLAVAAIFLSFIVVE